MSSVVNSPAVPSRLKQTPIDVWSIREKLALASSVAKSGDQNWYSVSRPLKTFSDEDRPSDWFGQKNCALQYAEMRESLTKDEVPKRKRGERAETAEELIVKKLRTERIDELKKLLADEKVKLSQAITEADMINNEEPDEALLRKIWDRMRNEQKAAEKEKQIHENWLKEREAKYAATKIPRLGRSVRPLSISAPSTPANTKEEMDVDRDTTLDESTEGDQTQPSTPTTAGQPGTSPLLTSLLQSPTGTSKSPITTPAGSPTKGGTASVVTTPFFSPTSALASAAARQLAAQPGSTRETRSRDTSPVKSPSAAPPTSSPTLSKLLETPITSPSDKQAKLLPAIGIEDDSANLTAPGKDQDEPVFVESIKPSDTTKEAKDVKHKSEVDGEHVTIEDKTVTDEVESRTPATRPTRRNRDRQQSQSVSAAPTPAPATSTAKPATPTVTTRRSVRNRSRGHEDEEKEKEKQTAAAVTETSSKKTSADEITDASISEESTDAKEAEAPTETPTRTTRRARGQSTTTPVVVTATLSTSTPTATTTTPSTTAATTRRSARRAAKGTDEEAEKAVVEVKKQVVTHDEGTMDASISEESTDAKESRSLLPTSKTPSISDSIPNSPASTIVGEEAESHRDFKRWQKSIILLWRQAHTHRFASIFHQPVSDAEAEGYSEIVKRPMDLQTIKKRIDNQSSENAIRTTAEFQRDIMLMFSNALIYNRPDHDVHEMADQMQDEIVTSIEDFVASQKDTTSQPVSSRKSKSSSSKQQHQKKDEPKQKKEENKQPQLKKEEIKQEQPRKEEAKQQQPVKKMETKQQPETSSRQQPTTATESTVDSGSVRLAPSTGLSGLAALRQASAKSTKATASSKLAAIMGKKSTPSTLTKTKQDWEKFKAEEGLQEELREHTKSKESFVERQAFLNRADLRQFEHEKAIRDRNRARQQNQK